MLNARQKRANIIPQTCKGINVAVTAKFIDAIPVFGMPSMGV
jgi:hypothetical protein